MRNLSKRGVRTRKYWAVKFAPSQEPDYERFKIICVEPDKEFPLIDLESAGPFSSIYLARRTIEKWLAKELYALKMNRKYIKQLRLHNFKVEE